MIKFLLQDVQQLDANKRSCDKYQQPNSYTHNIIQCFQYLHNPYSTPQMRQKSDKYLIQMEADFVNLLPALLDIYETHFQTNIQIALQALIYFINVIKRHWNVRRKGKFHSDFEAAKKVIKDKIISYLSSNINPSTHILYDAVCFIALAEYPHNFTQFTRFIIMKLELNEITKNMMVELKEIRTIFMKISQKKGHATLKQYTDQLKPILDNCVYIASRLKSTICNSINTQILDQNIVKISKYCDQIILSILVISPPDLWDQQINNCVKYCSQKLQQLIIAHQNPGVSKQNKQIVQKNIKSLIFSLGSLQYSYSFSITIIISDYFQILTYIIGNYQNFIKSAILRYTLLGLRKFIKDFHYYAQQQSFLSSIANKQKPPNYLSLRSVCHQVYKNSMSKENVEGFMQVLITELIGVRYPDQHDSFYQIDEAVNIDKDKQLAKQLTTKQCSLCLSETLIQRFPDWTFNYIHNILRTCMNNNWTNIQERIQQNIFAVVGFLPKRIKQNRVQQLYQIPILDILAYIHNNPRLKVVFPTLIMGWIDIFDKEQSQALIEVLLSYIRQQNKLQILLHCCQALCKIIDRWSTAIDMVLVIQNVFPVAVSLFEKTDNPQVLWPMVNLISTLITKTQFDTDIMLNYIKDQTLTVLLSNESPTLIEALTEMFRNFLCIIPRNKPADAIFKLVYYFLKNHLKNSTELYHEKVVQLWYYSMRQYSNIHNCGQLYNELFKIYYHRLITKKTVNLIYILEEYMLIELIDYKVQEYIAIIEQCYKQAQQMEQSQSQSLKVSALSFYITMMTKYGLQATNNHNILVLVLKDLFQTVQKKPGTKLTHRNSVLAIINRYIILYKQPFFKFCQSYNLNQQSFYSIYFKNMQYLTSRTAMKINAIALISLINYIDPKLLGNYFQIIIKNILPEVELAVNNMTNNINSFLKIQNSPTLRFSSNVLSIRKQQIRKKSGFDDINIVSFFQTQIHNLMKKLTINPTQLLQSLNQNQLRQSLSKFL